MKTLYLLLIVLMSCGGSSDKIDRINDSSSDTCKIESKNYSSPEKRIQVLKNHFNLKSEVIDAEYDIYDVNMNPRSIPGPTDRDYKIIVKINPPDFSKWNDPECHPLLKPEYGRALPLLKNNNGFDLSGKGEGYSNQNKEIIFFRQNGLILIRIFQH